MAKPTIVFVPGIWEGPSVFDGVSKTLQSYGYSTAYAPLASTGHASPGNPTLLDDVQHIRSAIEPIVEEGKEIILVGHSAGGFLGSAAVKDLGLKKRAEDGKTGGVAKLVYLAAGLAPEGWRHPDVLPFFDIQGNEMHCKEPMTTLFNDLPASVSETWLAKLQCQPATGWADVIEYAGWKDIPSVFLVCEKDAALPAALQVQSVEMAGSEIERCESGHMVMLSMPDTVVEVIRKAAGEAI